jgi:calcineurin-like phosphoesterase family protein
VRLIFTSDLAFGDDRHSKLTALSDELSAAQPDVMILAGNLGGDSDEIESLLNQLSKIQCRKAAIFGNQDVWNRHGQGSESLWSTILPEMLAQYGFTYLEHENLVIDRIGLCGSIAWYDYSGRDPQLKYTVEQYAELKGLVNQDAEYIDWQWSDQEFASHRQVELANRLETLERDRQTDHVVVITHFPVFGDALIRKPADQRWNFGMAYTFNLTLGRGIAPRSKVRHVVSGHIRTSGTWPITFGPNVIQMHIVGQSGAAAGITVINL